LSWYNTIVKLLLNRGTELEMKSRNSQILLLYTIWSGHEAVVKLLLNTGKVNIDVKDKDGLILLLYTTKNGYKAVVKLLLNRGAELETKDKYS
jgi:ankyrin repeat protein